MIVHGSCQVQGNNMQDPFFYYCEINGHTNTWEGKSEKKTRKKERKKERGMCGKREHSFDV